ncbi:SDR family NAD(P)-dependent oxidoreductase [Euzebya tangerina]|uniref:SDR family NAD(P)-dependent oxidoreductase n=1 Tax=Euzebya tangerina TaxID=591198 RepID=UPI0013C2B888|nr:SDR family oxidoreductase [Euzebya tangerina]
MSGLLRGKTIAVVAATGAIGSATTVELAAQGAHVVAMARHQHKLDRLLSELPDDAQVTAMVLDATDEKSVQQAFDEVAHDHGLDGTFNAVGAAPAELGYPARAHETDLATFMKPLELIVGSTFLTSRTAASLMAQNGGGAVVTLSATLSGGAFGFMANISAVCGAVEALTRSLSGEYGPAGVRINCLRGDAMPETTTIQATAAGQARLLGLSPEEFQMPPGPSGRPTTTAETAAAAAFLLSDAARGLASQTLTVSDTPRMGG